LSPGNESDPIYIDRVKCTVRETDLNTCTYFTKNQCSHDVDTSLVCNGMYITDLNRVQITFEDAYIESSLS